MAETTSSGGKAFLLNLLSSIGGSLVTSTSTAIWEHLKHGSVDWYGIIALFVLTGVVFFFLIFLLRKNHAPATHQPPPAIPSPAPSKLVIHSAYYGNSLITDRDVTARLKELARDGLVISVNNNELGCDPAPNQPPAKRLRVKYSYGNDSVFEVTRPEHSRMVLPEDEQGLDSLLTPLQIEAIQLSVGLLDFLAKMGKPLVPKYSREDMRNMGSERERELVNSKDKDWDFACEYYAVEKFSQGLCETPEEIVRGMKARYRSLDPGMKNFGRPMTSSSGKT